MEEGQSILLLEKIKSGHRKRGQENPKHAQRSHPRHLRHLAASDKLDLQLQRIKGLKVTLY